MGGAICDKVALGSVIMISTVYAKDLLSNVLQMGLFGEHAAEKRSTINEYMRFGVNIAAVAGSDECKVGTLMPNTVADGILDRCGESELQTFVRLRDLSPVECKGQGVGADEGGFFSV